MLQTPNLFLNSGDVNLDGMKKETTSENVLQVQTLLVYVLLVGVFVLCVYQMPKIMAFLQEYGDAMKAALPVQ